MPSISLIVLLNVLNIYSRAHLADLRGAGLGAADSNQRACRSTLTVKAQRARSVFDAGK